MDEETIDLSGEPVLDSKAQIDLTSTLQSRLLQTYLRRLENGTISDTGLAALQRLLQSNGWSLDPARIPQGLRDKLTRNVKFDDDLEDDGRILKAI